MHPILFSIGSFELYTYGLFMALGVLAGLRVVDAEAIRYRWDRDQMTRLVVFTFLMGLLGSRVVYVMTRVGDPSVDLLEVALNLRAGFVFYGGLAASWIYLVGYLWKKKLPFWRVLDAFALAICIGLAVGRIGCLLGGCCYGSPTTLPWGVVMVQEKALGHLHPVQAYEFFLLVLLFAVLWKKRLHKNYEGQMVVWFTGFYAVARFLLEYWRGDLIRGYLVENILSTSQFLSLLFLPIAIALRQKLRHRKN